MTCTNVNLTIGIVVCTSLAAFMFDSFDLRFFLRKGSVRIERFTLLPVDSRTG